MDTILIDKFGKFQQSKLFELIAENIDLCRPIFEIFIMHGTLVAIKALKAAKKIINQPIDLQFIYEASIMHDIGIIFTYAPDIDCFGKKPYMMHGILGAELLRKNNFPKHASVCETHTGVGITAKDIIKQKLDIPVKDYVPKTIEEKLICWADKFYSKNPNQFGIEKSVDEILLELDKISLEKSKIFLEMNAIFE